MSEAPPTRWTKWRDMFAAMRELLIVFAFVLLLVAPTTVRSTLERAGISGFAGIEFNMEGLAESEAEMEIAESEVEKLREQIAQLSQQLSQPPGASSNRIDPKDQVVGKMIRQMAIDAEIAQKRIKRSRTQTRRYMQEVQRHVVLTPPEKLFAPVRASSTKPAESSPSQASSNRPNSRLSNSGQASPVESTPFQWPVKTTITQPRESTTQLESSTPRIGSIRAQLQGLSNR